MVDRLDEERLEILRSWGIGLASDDREELRAAGKAITVLIEEIDRLQIDLWNARAVGMRRSSTRSSTSRSSRSSRASRSSHSSRSPRATRSATGWRDAVRSSDGVPEPASLCHTCTFVREVKGRLGQTYLMCQNEAIPAKYLPQPVLQCVGYSPVLPPQGSARES